MLRPDDLRVDSFATTPESSSAAAIPTTGTVPYSLLGSCYGCPSEVTVCPTIDTGTVA